MVALLLDVDIQISSRLAPYPKTKMEILNIQGLTGQWNEERFRSRLGAKA
jgi:hypothetical protein